MARAGAVRHYFDVECLGTGGTAPPVYARIGSISPIHPQQFMKVGPLHSILSTFSTSTQQFQLPGAVIDTQRAEQS